MSRRVNRGQELATASKQKKTEVETEEWEKKLYKVSFAEQYIFHFDKM